MDYRSDLIKVEIYTNFLYPGMILKGDGFDEKGNKLIDKDVPLANELITHLKMSGIKKIFYTRERLKVKKQVSKSMISDEKIEKAVSIIDDIQGSMKTDGAKAKIPAKEVIEVVNGFISDIKSNSDAFLNLLDLINFNDYTYTHSINVSTIAVLLGLSLKWDDEKMRVLGIRGLLHDIGKSLIPEYILGKPEKLNDEEWHIIKSHPVYGYNILRGENYFGSLIENAVLCHHEAYEGGGYPLGINHEKLNSFAEILSIADVFDASTSRKPYKDSVPFAETFAFFMDNSGKKFHPSLTQVFLRDMVRKINEESIYPEGSYVLLNTQEIGKVVGFRLSQYSLRPIVNIYFSHEHNTELPDRLLRHPLQIDLEGDYTRCIVKRIIDSKLVSKLEMICRG
jgi:putative nucleotidyltransferase with HDIG domain